LIGCLASIVLLFEALNGDIIEKERLDKTRARMLVP